jgi:hypothetical protein
MPADMLRLVCQVEDTGANRIVIAHIVDLIKTIPFAEQDWSVLKVEQVRPTFMARLITPAEIEKMKEKKI